MILFDIITMAGVGVESVADCTGGLSFEVKLEKYVDSGTNARGSETTSLGFCLTVFSNCLDITDISGSKA